MSPLPKRAHDGNHRMCLHCVLCCQNDLEVVGSVLLVSLWYINCSGLLALHEESMTIYLWTPHCFTKNSLKFALEWLHIHRQLLDSVTHYRNMHIKKDMLLIFVLGEIAGKSFWFEWTAVLLLTLWKMRASVLCCVISYFLVFGCMYN